MGQPDRASRSMPRILSCSDSHLCIASYNLICYRIFSPQSNPGGAYNDNRICRRLPVRRGSFQEHGRSRRSSAIATASTAASRVEQATAPMWSSRSPRFSVTGAVTFYDRAADSGNIVSRGFCGKCGSPIYSKNSAMAGIVFPRASVLDDPEIAKPQMIVYASRAPSWDHMSHALPAFPIMPESGPQKVIAEKAPS